MFDKALVFETGDSATSLEADSRKAIEAHGGLITNRLDEAIAAVLQKNRTSVVIISPDRTPREVERFLMATQRKLRAAIDLRVVACNQPDLPLQALAHELGIFTFWQRELVGRKILAWLTQTKARAQTKDIASFATRMGMDASRGNWKALEVNRDMLKKESPFDFRLAFLWGLFNLQRDKYAEAEESFGTSWKLNQRFVPALAAQGESLLLAGRVSEAMAIFSQIEKLGNNNPDRLALQALAHTDLNNWKEADDAAAEVAKLLPKHPRIKQCECLSILEDGDIELALALLPECQPIDSAFLARVNTKGAKHTKKQEYDKALDLYQGLYNLCPAHLRYKNSYNIALVFKKKGDLEKAVEWAKKALAECPDEAADKVEALIDSLEEAA